MHAKSTDQARKNQTRSQIRRSRKQMDAEQRKQETDQIIRHIMETKPYLRNASASQRTLLFYMPMPEEVNIIPLIEHTLLAGERTLLPRVTEKARTMALHVIESLADLEEKRSGFFEPKKSTKTWPIEEGLDGIIIPGIAFDLQGRRIGYGGGYYDTLLQLKPIMKRKPWTLAPAFHLQVVDEIPTESHDQLIDYIATCQGIIPCQPNRK